MSLFSTRELMRLLEIAAEPCLSIYLPTHRMGAETQQDSIRLKNLLSQAKVQLRSKTTLTSEEIDQRLNVGWQLVHDHQFWQHQEEGLALFCTADHTLMYHFPVSFKERVVVSEQFYIRPLLSMLEGDGQYHILAASQNDVRFFKANRDRIEGIEIDGLTTSLAEALKYDDPEQQQQLHQANSTLYHGQGAGHDRSKDDILRFFQEVNRGLQPYLSKTSIPLVFVGVDYLFPIYQQANTYGLLCDEAVTANPDRMHETEIHRKTWPIVQSIFERPACEALDDYCDRLQTEQTASGLLEILSAAHDGQISTLLVGENQEIYGRFDAEKRTLEIVQDPSEACEDLMNLAAVYTLFCNGRVYSVETQKLPADQNIAAILRYPKPVAIGMNSLLRE